MLNAYARGLHAYQKGMMLEENPFPPANADHAHWRTGWQAAQTQQNQKGK